MPVVNGEMVPSSFNIRDHIFRLVRIRRPGLPDRYGYVNESPNAFVEYHMAREAKLRISLINPRFEYWNQSVNLITEQYEVAPW